MYIIISKVNFSNFSLIWYLLYIQKLLNLIFNKLQNKMIYGSYCVWSNGFTLKALNLIQ